jgi:hypothetical protein
VSRQILVVLEGDAQVSGADGAFSPVAAGGGVFWEPGESHETRTSGGMTALVIEGDLEDLTQEVEDPRQSR